MKTQYYFIFNQLIYVCLYFSSKIIMKVNSNKQEIIYYACYNKINLNIVFTKKIE